MNDGPLVSIGVPVYNGEKYLRRALDSLLAQNYPKIELIVSDNASTDNTQAICREYAAVDSRLCYYRNEANIGMLSNFAKVLRLAGGAYFMWAAADDYWAPDFVLTMINELERHPEAGVAMSAVDLVDEESALVATVRFEGALNPNSFDHHQMFLAVTALGRKIRKYNFFIYGLFRRDILSKAMRFYVDTVAGDRLFICMMALITRFRYVDKVLHTRQTHKAGLWQRYPDETFSQIFYRPNWRYRISYYRIVFQLGLMLWRCDMIPLNRKRYIPHGMWRLASGLFLQNSLLYKLTAGFKRRLVKRFRPAI